MQPNPYGIEALWQQSDVLIHAVAFILLLMSMGTWMVILLRGWQILALRRQAAAAVTFWQAGSYEQGLQQLKGKQNPFLTLALEGKNAVEHHRDHHDDLDRLLPLTEWLTICLRNTIDEFAEKLQPGMGIMASVGSTSPFIGLFGTVWGIYHALIGISMAGHVNISEVAGPIGESLIMTAFGLVVAIPAVLGYNAINRANRNILGKLNRFAHHIHAFYLTGATPADSGQFFVSASVKTGG